MPWMTPIAPAGVAPFWTALAVCVALVSIVATIALALGSEAPKRREWVKNNTLKSIALFAVSVFATMYGGAKQSWKMDSHLLPGQSYATNDLVHVAWSGFTEVLPSDAVYIDCRLNGTTNEWLTIGVTTVGVGFWYGTLADATNYDYWVYTTYVPPTPVHTNGVYHLNVYQNTTNRIITIGSEIRVNGTVIAPPRKEEE